MRKKILWFMCGLPGSGKTTVIRRYFPTYQVIAADDYPDEMSFQIALIREAQIKDSLVVDGCFINRENRLQAILNLINHSNEDIMYEINFCVLTSSIDECILRNSTRHREQVIVTTNDIMQKAAQLTDPVTDGLPYSNIMYLDQYGNLIKIVQGEQFR